MTATERLRQLLDERGVEYSREGCETFFKNVHIWAINDKELCISISGLSPEQAVEATLGSDEVADLRQALADLWPRASFTMCPENRESWLERLAELGVEVES